MRKLKTLLVVLLALTLVASACSSSESTSTEDDPNAASSVASPDDNPTDVATDDSDTNDSDSGATSSNDSTDGELDLTLSDGQPADVDDVEPAPTVDGDALDQTQVDNVTNRLPEFADEPEDQQDFNRPADTEPPPTNAVRLSTTFPASGDDAPPATETGPLEVLRFQPEGDVLLAPYISVTFNQPMVPIGTLGQLADVDVPATITPDVSGHWEWIGTRTLRFESDSSVVDRLPMATSYSVEVPAGTTSASGNELASAVSWTFETPAPTVESLVPQGEPLDLKPIFIAEFDQLIDPDAVLPTITLTAGGDAKELRVATAAEIAEDQVASQRIGNVSDGRWIAFTPTNPLPKNSAINIEVGPGTPSFEGPKATSEAQSFNARTFAPLRVVEATCGRDRCQPLQPFFLEFNNQLDEVNFDESMITVDPEIPGMNINAGYNTITIQGFTAGNTDYRVTVSGDLLDAFGQTLDSNEDFTFEVSNADPALGEFDRSLLVVDPLADNPALTLPVINHDELRLRIYEVEPSDWNQFNNFQSSLYDEQRQAAPGREIADTTINVGAEEDVLSFVDIELGEYFDGVPGQLVVLVEPTGDLADITRDDDLYWQNRPALVWAQSTNIGLDVHTDRQDLVVVTTALDTGKPLGGVDVTIGSQVVTTGSDGLARLEITERSQAVVATNGDDLVWLSRFYEPRAITDSTLWHVVDDRGIYRPGETVRVKGWTRTLTLTGDAQLELPDVATVTWSVRGPQGNELATGESAVSPLGGFDLEFDLAEGTNLGQAVVQISNGDRAQANAIHTLQIQEFRTPEFEVSARNESVGPHFVAESATVAVEASYFSGGPLPGAPVDWTVTTRPGTYSPPNWNDFTFGVWVPWWYASNDFGDFDDFGFGDPGTTETFSGITDATGTHYLAMNFGAAEQDGPSTITANAAVFDVNRQVWSSDTSLLVHSGRYYVGLASDKTFVRQGESLDINAIVTDVDGNAVAGRTVDVVAEVLEWKRVDGRWEQVPASSETCSITSATEPQGCSFATERGGQYRISATVVDDDEGQNRTELTRWISGGQGLPSTSVDRQQAELVPDKETYEPGDTAEILVQSPFGPADGLLIITRNSFVETTPFTIDADTTVLEVPIDDSQIPNVNVQVELTGTAPRLDADGEKIAGAPVRPAYAGGSLTLRIPPLSRTLSVVATPQSNTLEPGAETSVDVKVTEADGAPVEGAELLLVVVDEAVLSLTDYQLADPIETFYQDLRSNLSSDYTRRLIRLNQADLFSTETRQSETRVQATSGVVAESEESAMDDSGDFAAQKTGDSPIDVRSNFDALAVFAPELVTAADGTAALDFTMPDNLTRYRVMVVAVAGDDTFGSGESNITARLPLQVRPSAPRFLNFGDTFELPIVVQNQTDEEITADVVVEVSNLTLTGPAGKQVTVPANDRVEVRFPVAAEAAGTARFRAAAASGNFADAAVIELPVYTPATSEAFATYGVVDDGSVFQPVIAPVDVWPQFGGLEINTSSTALQALTDAVIYVNDYEYRSSDAAASQILSISSLRGVLTEFDAKDLPTEAEMDEQVREAITTLVGLQNNDGGFPYWSRNRESVPYNTAHATHALIVAQQAGFTVPNRTLSKALQYLRDIEDWMPGGYSQQSRNTIAAYAIYVRNLWGAGDTPSKAVELFNRDAIENHSLDTLAWIWPSITDAGISSQIARQFNNRVTETAAGATFVNNYNDDDYVLLHSNRRTDGIVLDALISIDPDSDLIPKIVDGLLAGKTKGRWGNLQENTFILVALHQYFETFEDVTPDFVAKVWLGDTYAAEHTFEGRTVVTNETVVPMSVVVEEGDTDLVIEKDGDGRLYYRLGLDYAPRNLELDPLDSGFVVQRTYEAVDDDGDVWRDDDGVWHVKAGAEVRVRLTMVADSRRTHVALVDPLPAGLEILNPALAATEAIPFDEASPSSFYWWQWFNHQNLRDDRAEAFTNYLWAGTYDYSYVARATTPGTFVVPPAKAEEMYHPETFGRSSTNTLVVIEAG